jgi:WD40 repeat protein
MSESQGRACDSSVRGSSSSETHPQARWVALHAKLVTPLRASEHSTGSAKSQGSAFELPALRELLAVMRWSESDQRTISQSQMTNRAEPLVIVGTVGRGLGGRESTAGPDSHRIILRAMSGSAHSARGGSKAKRPVSPRTKLFQDEQFHALKALDIVLLNMSTQEARKKLRQKFSQSGDSLGREAFVEAVLDILPFDLSFRSPAGMGDGVENAKLNTGMHLSERQRRAILDNLVDRLDTDGDGEVDWGEMSSFILNQSAVVADTDYTVGRILPYQPMSESLERQAHEDATKHSGEILTTMQAKAHLEAVMAKHQAWSRGPSDISSLVGVLKPRRVEEIKENMEKSEATPHGGSKTTFNRSGIYGGVSLLEYIPEVDLIACVEPKVSGLRLLQPDDLSEAVRLSSRGRAVEAVTSFCSHTESFDQPYLVTASANSTISLYTLGVGRGQYEEVLSWPTPVSQQSLRYTQRYNLLFSGSSTTGEVHSWNVRTGEMLSTMSGHKDMTTGIVELEEQDRIASGSHDRTVRVWDLTTCRCDLVLRGHMRGVSSMDLYDERGLIVTGSYDHTVRVWAPQVETSVLTLDAHQASVVRVACSPGTPEVVTASADCSVCVWDMRRPRKPVHTLSATDLGVGTAEPAGERLEGRSVGRMSTFALCLRPRLQVSTSELTKTNTIGTAPLRPRGRAFPRKMPNRAPNGSVSVIASPEEAGLSAMGHPSVASALNPPPRDGAASPVPEASPSPDRTGSKKGSVTFLLDAEDSRGGFINRPGTAKSDASTATAAASPVVVRTPGGLILPAGQEDASPELDHEALAKKPDQVDATERRLQQIVFGVKTLHPYIQQESPELLKHTHRNPVIAVGYSSLNNTILTASSTGVRVWSAIVGVLTGAFDTLVPDEDPISAMIMDPRGVTFVIGTESGRVQLHNATSGHCIRKFSSHPGVVSALSWYGRAVVSASWRGTLFLHSMKESLGPRPDKHINLAETESHDGPITSIAASDNLGLIATGSVDGTVRVYKAATGHLDGVLRHAGMVTSVLAVPELFLLISADASGTVLFWSLKAAGKKYTLMAAFRHRPLEWLDPGGKTRNLVKLGPIAQQRKRKMLEKFKLGLIKASEADGVEELNMEDLASDAQIAASLGVDPDSLETLEASDSQVSALRSAADARRGISSSGSANRRAARIDDLLARAETIKSKESHGSSMSLAERLLRGDESARAELAEARRVAEASNGKRRGPNLRTSILASAGSSVLGSSSKPPAASPLASSTPQGEALSSTARSAAGFSVRSGSPARALRFVEDNDSPVETESQSFHTTSHVVDMIFELDSYSLFTGDDEGMLTRWDLKPLMTAMEVNVVRTATALGVDTRAMTRRLSQDMTAEKMAEIDALSQAPASSGAPLTIDYLVSAAQKGAFDKSRLPMVDPENPEPPINAIHFVKLSWTARCHEEAVTGLFMLRNPHMPETLLSCGFDRCVRGSDAQDGAMVGLLCQALTKLGVNPHWAMDVDVESWMSGASARVAEIMSNLDKDVKQAMQELQMGPSPLRVRSRTVAMVRHKSWKKDNLAEEDEEEDDQGEEDGDADLDLDVFMRASSCVPLPRDLRFSHGETPASTVRVNNAFAMYSLGEDEKESRALSRKGLISPSKARRSSAVPSKALQHSLKKLLAMEE